MGHSSPKPHLNHYIEYPVGNILNIILLSCTCTSPSFLKDFVSILTFWNSKHLT